MASRCGSARDKLCCWILGDIYLFYFCSVVDSIALQKVLRAHKIGASVLNLCFRFVLQRCHHLDFQSIFNLFVVGPSRRDSGKCIFPDSFGGLEYLIPAVVMELIRGW